MKPVSGELTPFRPFGLCDLIFMVRKDQVRPPAVNIERLSEVFATHGRALKVPPRTPGPPGAVRCRLSRLAALPQGKVHRMMLALIDLDPCSGHHVFETPVRQLA